MNTTCCSCSIPLFWLWFLCSKVCSKGNCFRQVFILVILFFFLTWLRFLLCEILSFFSEMLKDIFISFRIFGKKISRIAIIHLILMKRSDFHLVGVFSFFLMMRIYFLLKLNSYWSWMSKRFGIIFFIIRIISWSAESLISWSTCSKLKTILMTFSFSRTSCWEFGLTEIRTFSIFGSLTLSHEGRSTVLRLIDTAGSRVFSRRWLLIEELGVENTWLTFWWLIPYSRLLLVTVIIRSFFFWKDKFISFD